MFKKAYQQEDIAFKAHTRLSIWHWEYTPQLSFLLCQRVLTQNLFPRASMDKSSLVWRERVYHIGMIHALLERGPWPIIFATLWLLQRALSPAGVHKGIRRSPALLPSFPRLCLPNSTVSGTVCQQGHFSAPKNMD